MRLLEDFLSDEDITGINQVMASDSPRFDLLVKVSGLDPKNDFKFSDLRWLNLSGADLRGFDFTGSDLRNCVRNGNTRFDGTTILDGAKVEWIELEALPIVVKMQELEAVTSSEKRQQLLNELVTEFGRTTHVVTYMVSAAGKARSLDEFLDFALFIPERPSVGQSTQLRNTGQKLLIKKLKQSRSRTRRNATAIFATDNITKKLQQTTGSLAQRIFSHLADVVNSKEQTVTLNDMATIEPKDIEDAFSRIGQ